MYYMLRYENKDRLIPFREIERYKYHVLCESVVYPSEYDMSVPFRMSAHPQELIPIPWEAVVKWVEDRPLYGNMLMAARDGNEHAMGMLEKWREIKRTAI